jgi:hypothetical protein
VISDPCHRHVTTRDVGESCMRPTLADDELNSDCAVDDVRVVKGGQSRIEDVQILQLPDRVIWLSTEMTLTNTSHD